MRKESPNQTKKRTPSVMASNSNLKSSVSEKLIHLLGDFNFTPDSIRVLADYVVVLVSNRKCQSEAKAKLEPFLGHITTDFVSWLWDTLTEDSNDSNANKSSSDSENISGPNSSETQDVSSNIQSQNSGSGLVPRSTLAEETNEYASALSCKSNENFRATSAFENNTDGSLYGCSFKTKASAEVLPSYEQNMQYPKVHQTAPPLKHSQETKVGGRRLFSRAAGAICHQNGIRSRTVWDRLGKPTENDTSVSSVKHVVVDECVNIKRQMLEENLLGLGQNTCIPTVLVGEVKNLSRNCDVKTYRSNGGRKRQLNDFILISSTTSDTWDREEEISRKFTVEPVNYTCMLEESNASCKGEKLKSCNKCSKSGLDASLTSIPEKTSQDKLGVGVEDLDSTQTLISDSAFPAETGGIRLVQVVRKYLLEICKLKSQPPIKDGCHALSSSSGSVDHPRKDGVESRTVFVTNVHVAATQEALRSYFARCGPVNRVIKLTNTSTIIQKRSAYITFATKESVDKALALNGTNFFSRIIWVRKAGKVAVKPA